MDRPQCLRRKASATPDLRLPSHMHSTELWPVLISHPTYVGRLSPPEGLVTHRVFSVAALPPRLFDVYCHAQHTAIMCDINLRLLLTSTFNHFGMVTHFRTSRTQCRVTHLTWLMTLPPGQATCITNVKIIRWQWHIFTPYLCQLFSQHDMEQALRNVCYCKITFLVRRW